MHAVKGQIYIRNNIFRDIGYVTSSSCDYGLVTIGIFDLTLDDMDIYDHFFDYYKLVTDIFCE